MDETVNNDDVRYVLSFFKLVGHGNAVCLLVAQMKGEVESGKQDTRPPFEVYKPTVLNMPRLPTCSSQSRLRRHNPHPVRPSPYLDDRAQSIAL